MSPDGWDESVLEEEALAPPPRMELMAPVAGTECANAKNSSDRSAMVCLWFIVLSSCFLGEKKRCAAGILIYCVV